MISASLGFQFQLLWSLKEETTKRLLFFLFLRMDLAKAIFSMTNKIGLAWD